MVYSGLSLYEKVMFSCLGEKKSTGHGRKNRKNVNDFPWEREKYAAIVVPATPSLFGLVTPRRFWFQLGLNIQLHQLYSYSSNQNNGKDYNCRDAGTPQSLCFITNASLHSLIAPPPTQYSTWRPSVSSESYPAVSMGEQLVRSFVSKMKGRRPCHSRSKALLNHYGHRKDLDANWHRNVSLYRL